MEVEFDEEVEVECPLCNGTKGQVRIHDKGILCICEICPCCLGDGVVTVQAQGTTEIDEPDESWRD